MARLFLILILNLGWSSPAQARSTKNPFRVEAQSLTLAAGAKGRLRITIVVPKDHHLYRDMVAVSVLDAGGLTLQAPSLPPGLEKPDPADPATTREVYDMDVIIEVPITAAKVPGNYPVIFSVQYQGCKKSLCWMPQTEEVSAKIKVKQE